MAEDSDRRHSPVAVAAVVLLQLAPFGPVAFGGRPFSELPSAALLAISRGAGRTIGVPA